jgi:hypothetical protein
MTGIPSKYFERCWFCWGFKGVKVEMNITNIRTGVVLIELVFIAFSPIFFMLFSVVYLFE